MDDMVYFNAEVADQLINDFIKETRKNVPGYFQTDFFNKIHRGHSGEKWWQKARKAQRANIKDLQWICKKLQVDVSTLEVSDKPRGSFVKRNSSKPEQLEFDLEKMTKKSLTDMSDHEIIDKLGAKRIKEIYILSLYEQEKGTA